jgi:hypothetical protein
VCPPLRVSERGWGEASLRHEKSVRCADTANLERKAPEMGLIFRRCKTSFQAILLHIRPHGLHTGVSMARSISPRGRGSRCHTRDDAATMTVAAFAMSRFADLSNAIALAAIFLDAMQLISTLPTELTLERLPRRMFAAVSCLTWHAGLSPALLLHPSVRQCAASATAHLNRLHCILLASSSPSAFVPFPAAWRISPWKKPRVASADVEGRAVRSRTATCVAWFVQSVTPEEPRGQSLCGYGSPPCC